MIDAKMITLLQPFATLMAYGIKHVETRGNSTAYRGTVLIHAAQRKPSHLSKVGAWSCHLAPIAEANEIRTLGSVVDGVLADDRYGRGLAYPMPFGAVVAVGELVDVVPMCDLGRYVTGSYLADLPHEGDLSHQKGGLWLIGPNGITHGRPTCIEDQRPYGVFAAGRFAHLYRDVRPLAVPVPARGHQSGYHDVPPDVLTAVLNQIEVPA